jgi:hypothetical protein
MQVVVVKKWCLGFCATAFLAGLLAVPCPAGEVGDYLAKDGKLIGRAECPQVLSAGMGRPPSVTIA